MAGPDFFHQGPGRTRSQEVRADPLERAIGRLFIGPCQGLPPQSPRPRRAATAWRPTKPLAPVMSTRFMEWNPRTVGLYRKSSSDSKCLSGK